MFSSRRDGDKAREVPKPKLQIFGLEAADLLAEDVPGQSEEERAARCSPMLRITVGSQTMTTRAESNTVDPVFADANFMFGGTDKHNITETDFVNIEVLNYSLLGSKLIGAAEISYADLLKTQQRPVKALWMPITTKVTEEVPDPARPGARMRQERVKNMGRVRACLHLIDYEAPGRSSADAEPSILRVKVLRARGLSDSRSLSSAVTSSSGAAARTGPGAAAAAAGGGGAATPAAATPGAGPQLSIDLNPLIRVRGPHGKELKTRVRENTADPEWGDSEEFLFPAERANDPFDIRVESRQRTRAAVVLGSVRVEPRFFFTLPEVVLQVRLRKRDEERAARMREAERAKAAQAQPPTPVGAVSAAVAAPPDAGLSSARSVASFRGVKPSTLPRTGSTLLAAGTASLSDPDGDSALTIESLTTLGASDIPVRSGVLGGLPVYSQPVTSWFALRAPDGTNDGVPRGEVQLQLSWELAPTEGYSTKTLPRRVSIDGSSGSGAGDGGDETRDGDMAMPGGKKTGEALEEERRKKDEEQKRMKDLLEGMSLDSGDYRVLVHIIQVKDLHPDDSTGTADPCVRVEVMGKSQFTRTMWSRTSCVFDHIMWFDFPSLSKQEIETASIRVAVYDVDMLTSGDLIGEYVFDASYVYFREHHELHNQWVGISDPSNPSKSGVQGFLKISIAVLGPKDKRRNWDAAEEAKADAEENEKGIQAMLLMPPAVERKLEFLVVTAHLAQHLPALDSPQLFGLIQGGIDAFVQVEYGSGIPSRTIRVTRKGPSGELDPIWEQKNELWIPVLTPTMSTRVRVTLWDEDFALFGNELCSTVFLNYANIRKRPIVRRWYNLYGSPPWASGSNADRMNEYPDCASSYRGRLLISARVASDPGELEGHEEAPHARDAGRVIRATLPVTQRYELRALVVSGAELPQRSALLGAIAEGLGFSARDFGVQVSIGNYVLFTNSVTPKNRCAYWGQLLGVGHAVELPRDLEQVPDIFVHLFRGAGAKRVPISFARFPAKDLLRKGFAAPASWIHLEEDASVGGVFDDEQPGSVLMRLGFGSVDAAAAVDDWEAEVDKADSIMPYELRVHVYQGRNLPATDSNGSIDPWLKVLVGGASMRTPHLQRTTCPLWYTTLSIRIDLPESEELFPELLVQLWDYNRLFSDEKVSQLRISLSGAAVPKYRYSRSGATDLPDRPRDPKWLALTSRNREMEGPQGELLLSAELIALDEVSTVLPPPPKIAPETLDYFVEVIAMGLRDLHPYLGFPIYDPCLELDVGDRRESAGVKATKNSKLPSGTNPNFGERILVPIKLPINPIYAPSLNLTVRDRRLGGFSTPIVGMASVPLADKYPQPGGVPKPIQGSVRSEDPHSNALEDGETGPDAVRMAVKSALKKQQRAAEKKTQAKMHKKARIKQERAAQAARDSQLADIQRINGIGSGDPPGGAVGSKPKGGNGSQHGDDESSVSSFTASLGDASGRGSESGDSRRSLLGGGAAARSGGTLSQGGGNHDDGSDGDDVSTDDDDANPDANLDVEAEADRLLRRHKAGAASVILSSRGARPSSKAADWFRAGPSAAGADKRAASGAGADEDSAAVDIVVGDDAAGVDFSVFGDPEAGGGLMATRGRDGDGDLGGASAELVGDDLSWLYRHLRKPDAGEGVPKEDKAAGYLAHRREYSTGLEEALVTAPFETYAIQRGSSVPRGNIFGFKLAATRKRVGWFKGMIRIIADPRKTAPPIPLEPLLKPEQYLVRVYVLNGRDFQPADSGGKADPYLVLKLGDEKISDRANYFHKTVDPDIFRCYELRAELPGPSRLEIQVWDYDFVSFDDFMGSTVVDLEDRWFDARWQSFGKSQQTDTRLAPKPIEERSLYNATSFGTTGQLRLWVDILRPSDAVKYPKVDISPPPPRKFQLRVIVWRTRDVPAADSITKMNDLYVRTWLEQVQPQETDTHWRCKGGKASFNWRCMWDIELPCEWPLLTFQMWDRDILKWNDCIAEATLDLAAHFKRARYIKERYSVFDAVRRAKGLDADPTDAPAAAAASITPAESHGDDDAGPGGYDTDPDTDSGEDTDDAPLANGGEDATVAVAGSGSAGAAPAASMAAATVQADAEFSRMRRIEGVGKYLHSARQKQSRRNAAEAAAAVTASASSAAAGVGSGDGPAAAPTPPAMSEERAARIQQRAEARARRKARQKARGARRRTSTEDAENLALGLLDKKQRDALLLNRESKASSLAVSELDKLAIPLAADEEKADEARDTLSSFRTMLGIPEHPRAENAAWIPFFTNYVNGKFMRRKAGQLLVSVELVPDELKESVPAGRGRAEPNMNPHLPPPAGRMRFSLNPFYLGTECLGPGLFQQCLFCVMILGLILLFTFGAPVLDAITSLVSIIPSPYDFVFLGIICCCLCGPCCCWCIRSSLTRNLRLPKPEQDDHMVLDVGGTDDGAAEPTEGAEVTGATETGDGSGDAPYYGFMAEEEERMFLREAAIIARSRGRKILEQMGLEKKPEARRGRGARRGSAIQASSLTSRPSSSSPGGPAAAARRPSSPGEPAAVAKRPSTSK